MIRSKYEERQFSADAWKDESGRREAEIARENAEEAAIDRQEPGEEIRNEYLAEFKRLSGYGEHADARAFEAVAEHRGYVPAVRALEVISPHAAKLNAAYWSKRRAGR